MKKTKVIIPALGILLLSTAASVTGTVAWFSANAKVSADGMAIQAKTSESLVIDTDHAVGAAVSVTLDPFTTPLTPIHYNTGAYETVSNGADVDPATGLALAGKTLAYENISAATAAGLTYYQDYVIYLAAAGQAINSAALKVTATWTGAETTTLAATVDFKVLAVASADIGTQSAAMERDLTLNAAMASSDLTAQALKTVALPLNTSNTSVPVLMRLYVDGELMEDATKAYVRSDSVNLSAVSLKVEFTL